MRKIVVIFFIAFSTIVSGQVPELQWQTCFGTIGYNPSYGLIGTDNGYLLATGTSNGEGLPNYHGGGDIWLIETDTFGNKIWEKCFGGSNGEAPNKIIMGNNNYFILGSTNSTDGDVQSTNNGGIDYWVVKINQQGDIIWEKCYGSPGNEAPRDMLIAPDGGVIVMGRIFNSGGDVSVHYGSNDVWMFKTDSLGNIEWEQTLGNQYNDNGVSIIINSENNIMLIGAVDHYGGMVECNIDNYMGDVWLVELDLQGNIISQHCYGGSSYEFGVQLKEIENGYIFIAKSYSNDGDVSGHHGLAGIPPEGWGDFWIVKINDQREIIWQNSFGGFDSEAPEYITQTNDGGLLAIGTTYSNDGDVSGNHSNPGWDTDIWAVKLDSTGEKEWQQCYGGWGSERLENPYTILKKDDYNYVIASSTDYSPSYDVQCGSISGVDRDAWIFEIDLEDTTGIIDTPSPKENLMVYPNPARDYVVFSTYAKASVDDGEVIIIDVFGNEITRLYVNPLSGSNPLSGFKTFWDTRQVQNGIYFYNLEIEGKSYCGKVVVQK